MGFKEYKKSIDLSALQLSLTADSLFKNRYEMLSLRQLNKAIDSLDKNNRQFENRVRIELMPYLPFIKTLDKSKGATTGPPSAAPATREKPLIPDSARLLVADQTLTYASSAKTALESLSTEYLTRRKELRLHLIEWHNKFTMSLAVLVLFLIGAPLGSIVRRGGIGTPVVFAVLFFVFFFLLNNFGRKFVKEDVLLPFTGMWLATLILVPVGLFLIYKALNDSQLLNKDYYYRATATLKRFWLARNFFRTTGKA
jgi:lipopolysaccharide export system permease protein